MDSTKIKFSILTAMAVVLVLVSGIYLKTNAAELSRVQQILWGLIFFTGCLTFIRGVKLLGRH